MSFAFAIIATIATIATTARTTFLYPEASMLEKLRLIDWSAYSHAYGPADDVPDQIERLASPRPRQWVAALDTLFWTIYHQGNVFDCTAVAVPFLIELLQCQRVKCRGRIMELLAHIATCQACLGDEWNDDVAMELDGFCESGEDWELQLEWAAAARAAVWQGWRTYLSLGADLDKRARISSAYLLGQLAMLPIEELPAGVCGAAPATVIPEVLVRRLDTEPNDWVECSLLFAIEAWLPHTPQNAEVIRRHFECSCSQPSSRLTAALCACCLPHAKELAERAAEYVVDALEDVEMCAGWFEPTEPSIECRHNPQMLAVEGLLDEQPDEDDDLGADEDFVLPWMEEGLLHQILDRLAITQAPPPASLPRVLMDQLGRANQYTLENFAEAVRRFIIGERALSCSASRDEFTPQQLEVLRLLFHDASFWATNVGNVELAFGAMGVPYCRKTLARWLGQSAEVTCPHEAVLMLDQIVRAEMQAWLPDDGVEACAKEIRERMDTLVLAHIGSDVFMPLLEQFPTLEVLEIGPFTTDRGLAELPDLPLMDLTLDERVTDKGMQELLRFPGLRSLNTFGAKISDHGLEAIGQLRRLRSLYLSGNLTLAGLHALLPLTELTELSLPKMQLSLAIIPILQQLPSLTTLSLNGKCFDEAQRRRLKLELPACQIWFSHCGL